MTDLFIPTLHTLAMDNKFSGSCGPFRFVIHPQVVKASQKEVDYEKSSIRAMYWHGPLCFEKSVMEGEAAFPMTEDGRQALKSWLEKNI